MTGDQAAGLIAITLMLVLVSSALVGRRIPGRSLVRLVAIWLLIFGAAFMLFRLLDDRTPDDRPGTAAQEASAVRGTPIIPAPAARAGSRRRADLSRDFT